MNKTLIALALFSGVISAANAADGTINFEGSVLETACTATASSSTVQMGAISKVALGNVGATSLGKPVVVTLSSCPAAATTATITFAGNPDADNNQLFKIVGGSGTAATGIGLALYDADGKTLISPNAISAAKTLSATTDTVYNFTAKYMATQAAVTGGDANASTSFTVNYN
ncbi:type 1 fimbrial protein [Serratia proteamaculans]|uniref:fimbrial protein n=1 Tax=Serratia proteamaculans TaxID=28151 RepID=UPI001075DF6C|nr:fimbrial protein [Serratia proteamaculans]TFZ51995.1 type 1 fimbrial protein [Serratia proteamaculans]